MSAATFELPKIVQIIEVNADQYLKDTQVIKKATEEMRKKASSEGKKTVNVFKGIESAGDGMQRVGNKLSLGVTLPLSLLAKQSYDTYKSFDTAFRGVIKTVDMTDEEMASMKQTIRDLATEIPHTVEEISEVAEAAGQLGVEKDKIIDFTKVMLDMGVSTNMSAVEASESIAKFANVTGMSIKDADRFSSAVVDLGNKTATTERDIVSMAMRLAGAGRQLGMTEAQILAFSTALSSVGIEAEMGGSAMSKLMIKMRVSAETGELAQKVIKKSGHSLRELQMMASHSTKGFGNLAKSMGYTKEELTGFVETASMMQNWAKVTGNSTQEFAKVMKEDAVNGVMSFITGLSDMEAKGESAIVMLDEMGLKEVRLGDTIRRATGAKDLFNKALQISNAAWEENTALSHEAALFNASEANQELIRNNKRRDAMIELGKAVAPVFQQISQAIVDVANAFNKLDPKAQQAIIKFGLLAAAAGPFLKVGGGITSIIGKVGGGLLSLAGKATVANTAIGSEAAATGVVGGLKALAGKAAPFAVKLAPAALAIAAIGTAGFAAYKGLTQEAVPAVDLFADHVETKMKSTGEYLSQYGQSMEVTTTKISEKTKEQIGAYMKLSDETQRITNDMYTGILTITDTNIATITTNTKTMAEQIITANNQKKDESIKAMQEIFEKSTTLTSEEQKFMVETVLKGNNERVVETRKLQAELDEIYKGIKDGSIQYTSETQEKISTLMLKMKSQAVTAMSQNEIEQNVIMQRLGASNTRVTTEMVSDAVKQMNKLRDDSIAAAEAQRTERIRIAENLRAQLPVEEKYMADKMIEEANRMADEQIKSAESVRDEGLYKMREAYGDVVYDVDTYTGRIVNHLDRVNGTANRFRDDWNGMKLKSHSATVTTKYITTGNAGAATAFMTATQAPKVSRQRGYDLYSHYNGLDAVPYDGYQARLHKGERILSPREAQNYNDNRDQGIKVKIENFVNNREQDVESLAKELNFYLKRQNLGRV